MTSLSRRKPRTTACRTTARRTGISLAVLAAVGGGLLAQPPASVPPAAVTGQPPTRWTPFQEVPTTPGVPVGTLPKLIVTTAPISAQPGLVPKTLTFQKTAGETAPQVSVPIPALPPVGVPAVKTAFVRPPQAEPPKKDDPPKDDPTVKKDPPMVTEGRQAELTKGTLPNPQDVFRLTSDPDLNARIQKELGGRKDPFPVPSPLSTQPLTYRPKTETYPPMQSRLEPNYVIHRRLYFEEPNGERAAWDIGPAQAFVSSAYFIKDVFLLPHNYASGFHKNRYDTSAGKCLPGSPTPYYLYPPGFTVSGLLFQVPLITGLAFIY